MPSTVGYGRREFLRICSAVKPNFDEKTHQGGEKIEMLLGTSTREVELATIEISDVNVKFTMPVEVTKVDKGELKKPLPRIHICQEWS